MLVTVFANSVQSEEDERKLIWQSDVRSASSMVLMCMAGVWMTSPWLLGPYLMDHVVRRGASRDTGFLMRMLAGANSASMRRPPGPGRVRGKNTAFASMMMPPTQNYV